MSFEGNSDYEDVDSEMEEQSNDGDVEDMEFLTYPELDTELKSAIAEVHAILQVSPDVCRLLLHQFKWNKEALFDKFYDCPDTDAFLVAAKVIPKGGVASVTVSDECDICCEFGVLSGLACNHKACSECWKSYLTEKIMVSRQCEIECMANGCELLVEEEKIHSYIDDAQVLDSYDNQKVNSFVMSNPYMKWCPGRDCGRAVKTISQTAQLIQCPCGARFCFCCGQNWHEPITCEHLKLWVKRCEDDSETFNWIVANTKDCPKCHVTIEKNGGCNHMSCRSAACRHQFCWLCMGDWSNHRESGCNSYTESEKDKNREKSRVSLNRYLFYYNRFMAHSHSLKLEKKLKDQVAQKMEQLQAHPVSLAYVQVRCLGKAVETLSECRETLMNTYAFAFYLKKDNNSMIFEANQKDLELATEALSRILERDINVELEEKINFLEMILMVQDKSRYVEARRKILLEHCVEGYENGFWEFSQ